MRLSTGIAELDTLVSTNGECGYETGSLNVIVSPVGGGKTILLDKIIITAQKKKAKWLRINMEMIGDSSEDEILDQAVKICTDTLSDIKLLVIDDASRWSRKLTKLIDAIKIICAADIAVWVSLQSARAAGFPTVPGALMKGKDSGKYLGKPKFLESLSEISASVIFANFAYLVHAEKQPPLVRIYPEPRQSTGENVDIRNIYKDIKKNFPEYEYLRESAILSNACYLDAIEEPDFSIE